jgi:hypothetical protein
MQADYYLREVACFVWVPDAAYDALTDEGKDKVNDAIEVVESAGEPWHGYMSERGVEGFDTHIRILRENGGDTNMEAAEETLREWQDLLTGLYSWYCELLKAGRIKH